MACREKETVIGGKILKVKGVISIGFDRSGERRAADFLLNNGPDTLRIGDGV